MRISDDRLIEFQRIYKEVYGEEISVVEAREMAQRLLTLYEVLMRPLPGESGRESSQNSPARTEP